MNINDLTGLARRAMDDHAMIAENDRICIGVSGGKDSLTLASILKHYSSFCPQHFSLVAVNLDMQVPNTDPIQQKALADHFQNCNIPYYSFQTEIYDVVFRIKKEKNPCSLCSKLRRGILNSKALELGCNKIALGHHADDLVETMLLSLCYEGRLSTFQPVSYLSRSNLTVIRPMVYIEEKNIVSYANSHHLPILDNPCPADKHTKREDMKQLIVTLQKDIPFVKERMIGAITHPERYHLWNETTENPVQKEPKKNQ